MTDFERKLAQNLYRVDCPAALELGEYHLGMLAPERGAWIRMHLRECRFCAAEVAQLDGYLQELKADWEQPFVDRLSSRVQTWIARLIPDLSAGMQPSLALRGTPGALLSYEAGEAQLHLEVQLDPQHADRRALLGLLVGVDPQDLQAWLLGRDDEIQVAPVDDLSNFTFASISPDQYTLLVRGPSFEIVVGSLPVD